MLQNVLKHMLILSHKKGPSGNHGGFNVLVRFGGFFRIFGQTQHTPGKGLQPRGDGWSMMYQWPVCCDDAAQHWHCCLLNPISVTLANRKDSSQILSPK